MKVWRTTGHLNRIMALQMTLSNGQISPTFGLFSNELEKRVKNGRLGIEELKFVKEKGQFKNSDFVKTFMNGGIDVIRCVEKVDGCQNKI